ncbi:MAG: penicillin acylase family protein [Actinomycetota bacterium]
MEDWVAAIKEYAKSALRPTEGTVALAGLQEDVEVFTDRWGVPHVYAKNTDDAYFAQGYLHAAERLWQIDFTRRAAQGRLAEIVGQPGLALDRFFRTLGFWRFAKKLAGSYDDESLSVARPYHAGFQAALRSLPKPAEYQLLNAEPNFPDVLEDTLVDVASLALMMSFQLSANWPFELLRAELAARLGVERARELTPFINPEGPIVGVTSPNFPGVAQQLRDAAYAAGVRPGVGSNNWVVSGEKSTTGKPLLANDPHLLVQMPAIWMEMHLSAPDLDVTGVSLPGLAGIAIGHNRRVAWGFTNTQADVTDLYVERLSEDGSKYEYKGKWLPVKRIREKITVLGEAKPIVHEVRETRHGPLITSVIAGGTTPEVKENAITEAVAFRWIQREMPLSAKATSLLNHVSNWEEFREAARAWPISGQNMIYADVDGNIGYQFTGTVPIRTKGTGVAPVPGWTGEYEWKGTIPFNDLPRTYNPEKGFVATANHRMVDADYPYLLTQDWEMPHRIRRIVAMLTAKEKLDHDDFKAMHMDTFSGIAAELVPLFLQTDVTGERETEALKHVETWDLRLDVDSVGASIFNAWFARVSEALFAEKLGPELYEEYYPRKGWTTNHAYDVTREILTNPSAFWVGGDGSDNAGRRDRILGAALSQAVEDLEARLGPSIADWRWGRLHQVHFRHILANAIPPLNELFSSGPFEVGGGDDTVNRGVLHPSEGFADGAIASYRQIIDLGDFDKSESVITTGNSGNPASPHFADQSPMWATGEYHPMPFSRAAVEAASDAKLVMSPGA